jgi:hypothetical protein
MNETDASGDDAPGLLHRRAKAQDDENGQTQIILLTRHCVCRMSSRHVSKQVVLLRVGIDAGYGGIQGSLMNDGTFEFICIPDRKGVSVHTRPSRCPSGVMTISTSLGVVQSLLSRQPRIAW